MVLKNSYYHIYIYFLTSVYLLFIYLLFYYIYIDVMRWYTLSFNKVEEEVTRKADSINE